MIESSGILPSVRLASRRLSSDVHLARIGLTAAGGRAYVSQITLGKAGRCPEVPVLVILVFDNSASITGGNDPVGQRFLEAELALNRVGARCRCGRDLAAVIHFDTPTSGDFGPTPIAREDRGEFSAALAIPADGAGISCLGPSLIRALALAKSHQSTHRIVLVAMTDFELFDDSLDQFIAFPGDVHAVSLTATPPAGLHDAETVTVTHITHASRPGAVARAVFTAITADRPRSKALPAKQLAASAYRSTRGTMGVDGSIHRP